MKYYLFRVKDNLGQEYYLLNNQFIGYLGFDSQSIRSTIEWHKSGEKLKHAYQMFAESEYIPDQSEPDRNLHKLNCDSTRFTKREAEDLIHDYPELVKSKNKTWYQVFYPKKNSSRSYLKEIGGKKTIE